MSVVRVDPPLAGDETATLLGLDYHRDTLRIKVEGREYAEPWASVDWDADCDWDRHYGHADLLRESIDGRVGE